ncbi:MAG: hypothetical protein AVDCRST_MAG85-3784, partial [uncultured Solirubrobacteraceae bacterium]
GNRARRTRRRRPRRRAGLVAERQQRDEGQGGRQLGLRSHRRRLRYELL